MTLLSFTEARLTLADMSEHEGSVSRGESSPVRSPLTWALLGLIIEHPSYGYELAERFQRVYEDTLVLSNRMNVYRLLKALSSHGLIEEMASTADEVPARNRLPKPRYRATAHGKRTYEEWLVAQLGQEFKQQRLFARQLAMLEPEQALEVLERYERDYLEEGEETLSQASDEEGIADVAEDLAEHLAHEDIRLKWGSTISWLRYARRELKLAIQERDSQP